MADLVPSEPPQFVACPRCHTNLVRDVGLFRRREMCPACVVLEGSVASVHNKYISLIALVVGVVTMLVGVIALVISYLTLRQANASVTKTESNVTTTAGTATDTTETGSPQPQSSTVAVTPTFAPPIGSDVGSEQRTSGVDHSPSVPIRNDDSSESTPPRDGSTSSSSTYTAREPVATPLSEFADDLTVTASSIVRHAEPRHRLVLPVVPVAMRSYLSGRCVELSVTVAANGDASAVVTQTGGVHELFVARIVNDATRPWRPAATNSGLLVEDTRIVRYCWS